MDLDGGVVPHTYKLYSTTFVASLNSTNISFAFRNDPFYLFLDDVSVTLGLTGPNLLTNGGFESGVVGDRAPTGWTYFNQFDFGLSGRVSTLNPHSGNNDYQDGSIQVYYGITQAIATSIGSTYTISFWLMD